MFGQNKYPQFTALAAASQCWWWQICLIVPNTAAENHLGKVVPADKLALEVVFFPVPTFTVRLLGLVPLPEVWHHIPPLLRTDLQTPVS